MTKIIPSISLILLLATSTGAAVLGLGKAAGQTSTEEPCNCIIFRLDDVQDTNFSKVAMQVMDTFIRKNQSLVVSLVMNKFGSNQDVVEKVAEGHKKDLFEIAGHGWDHVVYAGAGLEQQQAWLSRMNAKIREMFGVPASTFVPPLAPFDHDTLLAMSQLGLKVISSEFEVDRHPFFTAKATNVTDEYGIFHIPATAKFYDYAPAGVKMPLPEIMDDIDTSISSNGWAVVVMHPQDFGEMVDGKKVNRLDRQEMEDLAALIDDQISKNRKIVTFSDLAGLQVPEPVDVNPPRFAEEPLDVSIVRKSLPAKLTLKAPPVIDLIDSNPVVTSNQSEAGFNLGTTVVRWNATDQAGNSAETAQLVTVVNSPDTFAPELSIVLPESNSNVDSLGSNITVMAKALDLGGSGIKKVEIRSSLSKTFTTATAVRSDGESEWEAKILLDTPGEQMIIATAQDYFGNKKFASVPIVVRSNETKLNSTTLTLDYSPLPEFSLGNPASFTVSGRLTESGTPDKGIPGQKIELLLSGEGIMSTVVTGADGSFSTSARAPEDDPAWTVKAHYPGDAQRYQSSDSNEVTYSCFSIVGAHFCSSLG
jgi:peptidoglycan/xylan/chitin deacetylase (PgdA/CDA1 family)